MLSQTVPSLPAVQQGLSSKNYPLPLLGVLFLGLQPEMRSLGKGWVEGERSEGTCKKQSSAQAQLSLTPPELWRVNGTQSCPSLRPPSAIGEGRGHVPALLP